MTPKIGSMAIPRTHPSGRVQILDRPLALPGKCIICGASDNDDGREYIDVGFEIEYYGVVYFCTHCFGEIALASGFTRIKNLEDLSKDYSGLIGELAGVSAENVKLRVALNNLDFLGAHDTYDNPSNSDAKKLSQTDGTKRPDNSKSAKQVTKSGHSNISTVGKSDKSEVDIIDF